MAGKTVKYRVFRGIKEDIYLLILPKRWPPIKLTFKFLFLSSKHLKKILFDRGDELNFSYKINCVLKNSLNNVIINKKKLLIIN